MYLRRGRAIPTARPDLRDGSILTMTDSTDDIMIDTPDGPMTFAAWKKKHPVQIPSRRTKGKDLPVKVKRFTEPK